MTRLFISDLHLDPERPALIDAFLAYLRDTASRAEALYILGDLFEAWIGDDDNQPRYREIRQALRTLSDGGTALYVMHGNRDFLIGKRFCRDTGATLLDDPSLIDLYGRRALVMHGDLLCTGDQIYLATRARVRKPFWKWRMQLLPLFVRRHLARKLREKSRRHQANQADAIIDVTPEEVPRVMAEAGVDLLIHGHTHRPARHPLTLAGGPGERIVLGDWGATGWHLRAEADGSLALEEFAL